MFTGEVQFDARWYFAGTFDVLKIDMFQAKLSSVRGQDIRGV